MITVEHMGKLREYMGKCIHRDSAGRYLTCSETFKTLSAAKAYLRRVYLNVAAQRAHVAMVAAEAQGADMSAMRDALRELYLEIDAASEE